MTKTGILLVNLGTPDDPTPRSVKKYLDEFLMDPLVIDLPYLLRLLLVKGLITPRRSSQSAEAYQKIWNESKGSPLLFHSEELKQEIQQRFADHPIELAMRYGSPSLPQALERLHQAGVAELVVLPLYPQFSLAATQSSLDKIQKTLKKMRWAPRLSIIEDFYEHPHFVRAFAELGRLKNYSSYDQILFSFHGLPEHHIHKLHPPAVCQFTSSCCEKITDQNRYCYRAQCFATARAIAHLLDLPDTHYQVSFQSRLGKRPWIQPFTDVVLKNLAQKGVKKVLVYSPSFVADCLETLEEIEIRERESFLENGGETLDLVPSLNTSPLWVEAVEALLRERMASASEREVPFAR